MITLSPHPLKGDPSSSLAPPRPLFSGKRIPMVPLKLAVKLACVVVLFGVLFASASAQQAADVAANTYGTSSSSGNKCINGAKCFSPSRSGCPSGSYQHKTDSKCYPCSKLPNCTGGETCTHERDSKCPKDRCEKGCNHDGIGNCVKPPTCPSGQYWDAKFKRCKACSAVEHCNKVTCTGPNDSRCDPRGCRDDCFHRDGKCHPKPPRKCEIIGEYWDDRLRKCVKCDDIPNCEVVECTSSRDETCIKCDDGFITDAFGKCKCDCDSNPTSKTCEDFKCTTVGTYFNSDLMNSGCRLCPAVPNCDTTSVPRVGEVVCDNCSGANSKCVGQCKTGYFNNDGKCEQCPSIPHCAEGKLVCTSKDTSVCTKCAYGYELDPATLTCKCPKSSGLYEDNNQCKPCTNNPELNCLKVICDAVDKNTKCDKCKDGFYLENGICKSCSGGASKECKDFSCTKLYHFFNKDSGNCEFCPDDQVPNCPDSNRVCNNCDGSPGKCIGPCDSNYWNNNGVCTECQPVANCLDTNVECPCGVSKCSTCIAPFVWDDELKICKCPSPYQMSGQNCICPAIEDCDVASDCTTYSYPYCPQCRSGYTWSDTYKACVSSTPPPQCPPVTLNHDCGEDTDTPIQLTFSTTTINSRKAVCVDGRVVTSADGTAKTSINIKELKFDIAKPQCPGNSCALGLTDFLTGLKVTQLSVNNNKDPNPLSEWNAVTCGKPSSAISTTDTLHPKPDSVKKTDKKCYPASDSDADGKGNYELWIQLNNGSDPCVQQFHFCVVSTSACEVDVGIFQGSTWYAHLQNTDGNDASAKVDGYVNLISTCSDKCPAPQ